MKQKLKALVFERTKIQLAINYYASNTEETGWKLTLNIYKLNIYSVMWWNINVQRTETKAGNGVHELIS